MLAIETLDPITGAIEHISTLVEYREANAEDAAVMAALDKLEREGGEVAVGHVVLRRGEPVCDDVQTLREHYERVRELEQENDELRAEKRRVVDALEKCAHGMTVELDEREQGFVSKRPGGKYRDALDDARALLTGLDAARERWARKP